MTNSIHIETGNAFCFIYTIISMSVWLVRVTGLKVVTWKIWVGHVRSGPFVNLDPQTHYIISKYHSVKVGWGVFVIYFTMNPRNWWSLFIFNILSCYNITITVAVIKMSFHSLRYLKGPQRTMQLCMEYFITAYYRPLVVVFEQCNETCISNIELFVKNILRMTSIQFQAAALSYIPPPPPPPPPNARVPHFISQTHPQIAK